MNTARSLWKEATTVPILLNPAPIIATRFFTAMPLTGLQCWHRNQSPVLVKLGVHS